MTCTQALSLLDEFVDGDLKPTRMDELRVHLDGCPECRSEYEDTKRLKELLKQRKVQDPGPDYWQETLQLILARTVETSQSDEHHPMHNDQIATRRNAFIRALVSLAASLAILTSAILISQNQDRTTRAAKVRQPIILTSSLQQRLQPSNRFVTNDEWNRLTRGMLLLGSPGFPGRYVAMTKFDKLAPSGYSQPSTGEKN
ncbi:MAG: zf-HC2 domain-containing protein [candidate division Zixibacteria bacterium]|nr:zf-HC2 domain-containing protein [candidate division Zixibacteria bacterium]